MTTSGRLANHHALRLASGLVAKGVLHPLDVLKKRLQVSATSMLRETAAIEQTKMTSPRLQPDSVPAATFRFGSLKKLGDLLASTLRMPA